MKSYTSNISKLLSDICGLSNKTTTGLLKLLSKASIHNVATEALDCNNGKLRETTIEVPYVCTLTLKIVSKKEVKVKSVKLDELFERTLLEAVNTGVSPLVEASERKLIELLKRSYDSLF